MIHPITKFKIKLNNKTRAYKWLPCFLGGHKWTLNDTNCCYGFLCQLPTTKVVGLL